MELAAGTDLCVAAPDASFAQPEIRLGLFAPRLRCCSPDPRERAPSECCCPETGSVPTRLCGAASSTQCWRTTTSTRRRACARGWPNCPERRCVSPRRRSGCPWSVGRRGAPLGRAVVPRPLMRTADAAEGLASFQEKRALAGAIASRRAPHLPHGLAPTLTSGNLRWRCTANCRRCRLQSCCSAWRQRQDRHAGGRADKIRKRILLRDGRWSVGLQRAARVDRAFPGVARDDHGRAAPDRARTPGERPAAARLDAGRDGRADSEELVRSLSRRPRRFCSACSNGRRGVPLRGALRMPTSGFPSISASRTYCCGRATS